MRLIVGGVCLGMFLICLSVTNSPLATAQKGKRPDAARAYGWLTDISSGVAESKRSGKPIMVLLRCIP